MRRTARLRIGAVLAAAAVVITGTAMSMTMASADPAADPSFSTQALGTNLSLGAGADGTSKASGTSFGNVIDGNASTYWSPSGTTGRVSVKWGSAQTVSTIIIEEASGAVGNIGSWQVVNNDNGSVLASGTGAGTITFSATSTKKINFVITGASATPRIAEFETYSGTPDDGATETPTEDPTTPGDPGTTPPPSADALYASPNGSASADGSVSNPTTLASAISRINTGGTIYLRGGTYSLSAMVDIPPGKDGTSSNRTELFAYPGENPVLNFSAQAENTANRGIALGGDWWHLKGFVVEHAGDNGILLGGSNNIIERVVTRHNADTGLQIARYTAGAPSSEWPANNLVLSSESHDNVDSDGEDADGFAAKLTSGDGNVFRFCVAHNNIDDGWDLYTKSDTGPIGEVTIEDSLAYDNGTLSNGGQAGNGDRNGFKLGGEDIAVDHTVVRTIAFENGKHGFTYNSNPGSHDDLEQPEHPQHRAQLQLRRRQLRLPRQHLVRQRLQRPHRRERRQLEPVGHGSNGSRCSAYGGSLSWSFNSGGTLVVSIGGAVVDL